MGQRWRRALSWGNCLGSPRCCLVLVPQPWPCHLPVPWQQDKSRIQLGHDSARRPGSARRWPAAQDGVSGCGVMDALLTLPLRGERRMHPKPGVKVLPALLPSHQPITPFQVRACQEPQLARITDHGRIPWGRQSKIHGMSWSGCSRGRWMEVLRVVPVPRICSCVPLGCLGAPHRSAVACIEPGESRGDVILPRDSLPAPWGRMRGVYWQPSG